MNENIFILFDIEYTAWEGSQQRNWSHDNEYKEIICISALKINKCNNKLQIKDKFNYYVKPKLNPILSDYIINLTGITQTKIDTEGYNFEIALEAFYIFCENYNIYSYGNDYTEIKVNLHLNNISKSSKYFIWESQFYDIKPILNSYNINTSNYTSGSVYKSVGLKPNNVKIHDSMWDTYSLFITLNYLLKNNR